MAEQNDAQQEDKKGGGKKKLIIIIGAALVVLLLVGGIVGFFLLKDKKSEEESQDPGADVPVPELTQSTEIGPMVDISEFIVNIISEDNNHYVKAAITLELSNEEARDEATLRMPQIKDSVILLVGNKTYDELHDLQGKKQLKAELLSKINGFLMSGKVNAIYFTDFVVQ